ncbi:hypothetical protein EVAR_20919_1 [Eumeta japonica]|uniref:Uncharacterized protein n=1 Tax=Eumeta variegata TaxID=151549 RepID=A0A4C1UWS5_EUMVA|nr:hypothetical protein EVAR_20919_1 [Eumeta japonica]
MSKSVKSVAAYKKDVETTPKCEWAVAVFLSVILSNAARANKHAYHKKVGDHYRPRSLADSREVTRALPTFWKEYDLWEVVTIEEIGYIMKG